MKVAWKIALYNLVFHQLPLIQHCSIFYKKNAFQSTKIFRRIQWQNMLRMASECISYNLEFQHFPPTRDSGSPSLAPPTLNLLYKLRLLLQFFLRTLFTDSLEISGWRPFLTWCQKLAHTWRKVSENLPFTDSLEISGWRPFITWCQKLALKRRNVSENLPFVPSTEQIKPDFTYMPVANRKCSSNYLSILPDLLFDLMASI